MMKKIEKVPRYFQILVIVLVALNFSAFAALKQKNAADQQIATLVNSLTKLSSNLTVKNAQLTASPQDLTTPVIELSVLTKPSQQNYLYFAKDVLNISLNGQSSSLAYPESQTKDQLMKSLVSELMNFSVGLFFIYLLKMLLMLGLLLALIILAGLVLTRFRMKARAALFPLFIAVATSGAVSLSAGTFLSVTWQFLSFAGLTGLVFAGMIYQTMDKKISAYYSGA